MHGVKRFCVSVLPVLAALAAAGQAHGFEIRIDNPVGAVKVRTLLFEEPRIRVEVPGRPARQDDVRIERKPNGLELEATPSDGAEVNIEIDAPFNTGIQVKTVSGSITYQGYPARFSAVTIDGDLDITAPWEATRLLLFAGQEPKRVETPDGFKFRGRKSDRIQGMNWVLSGELEVEDVAFGNVQLRTTRSKRVTLRHTPIPDGAPVKMPWQAKPVAERLLGIRKAGDDRAGSTRPRQEVKGEWAGTGSAPDVRLEADGTAVFSSEVRMVNLTAAVYDEQGRPISGLTADDFEVVEDGVPQRVEAAAAGEEPFNLAILLDLSASTQRDREQMKKIADGFLGIAQDRDRVALHALANSWFIVLSNLTRDRDSLAAQIERMPELSGSSPVYDSMILSYAEELERLPDQRNALIAITDGRDNRFDQKGLPSEVGFGDFKKAAEVMNCLIYPIYIGPLREDAQNRSYPAKAYDQLVEIAAASGGRVFHASTVEDGGDVYQQVADELRSVYNVAYYPENQSFDGGFRQVTVRVNRPGATVRTREGYVAR